MIGDPTEERPTREAREQAASSPSPARPRYRPPAPLPAPPLTDDSDRRFARDFYRAHSRWPQLGYQPDNADIEWMAGELASIEVAKEVAAADQADPMSPYHQGPMPEIGGAFADPARLDAGSSTVYDRPDNQPTQVPTQQEEVKMPDTLPSETAAASRPPQTTTPPPANPVPAKKSLFAPAIKSQGKLRIALDGPSGAGKTFSALLIATGISESMDAAKTPVRTASGRRIALIDTENASAADYADRFVFDLVAIDAPYTVEKYLTALNAAEAEGYDVVVTDSLSHAWAGEGGLLRQKEALDRRGGNQYANWALPTKMHEALKSRILSCKIHLIATMRSKQEYALQGDDKTGKTRVVKLGMAPVQREGMEYEFTVCLDLAMDHSAIASKDRTAMFDEAPFKPTKDLGRQLYDWRMKGVAEAEGKPSKVADAPVQGAAKGTNGSTSGTGKVAGAPQEAAQFPTSEQYLAVSKLCMAVRTTLYKEKANHGWGDRQITVVELNQIAEDLKARAKGGAS